MEAEPHYLSQRANWEADAVAAGHDAEESVASILRQHLDSEEFEVEKHPSDLRQLYYESAYALNPEDFLKPNVPLKGDVWYDDARNEFITCKGENKEGIALCGGCIPDLKIRSKLTGKVYFIECKRQNDSGNAHERCAKYATPSIIELIQKRIGGVSYHPVGYVFTGDMIKKRKYILELQATFGFARNHLLLWNGSSQTLLEWVQRTVVPLLR